MAGVPTKMMTWQMVKPTTRNKETGEVVPGELEKKEFAVPKKKTGEGHLVVAGCGGFKKDLG